MMTRIRAFASLVVAFGFSCPIEALAQDKLAAGAEPRTWVNVQINCCSVRRSEKYPTEGLRSVFTGQIGGVTLACTDFFEQDSATYPGGLPQRDGSRIVNLKSMNRSQIRQDLCQQMRAANETCCEAFTVCEQGCSQAARQSFGRLYGGLAPSSTTDPSPQAVIDRFLSNCESARLLEQLVDMPCHWDRSNCRMGSRLRFKLRFGERQPGDLEAGHIEPETFYPDPSTADPNALRNHVYTIFITNERASLTGGGGTLLRSSYPDPGDSCFDYSFSDPVSQMAATLYHELLHLWWMNTIPSDRNNSGHGTNLGSCSNYEAEFIRRLRGFYRVMDAFENCAAKPAPKPQPVPSAKPAATPGPAVKPSP